MKKLFVLMIAVFSMGATATAQESIAMLKHGTTTKTFTGVDALKSAHEAAENGDLITLSSGNFNAVDITKTVTIRGAGMEYDVTYNTQPTIIRGDFTIAVPDGTTGNVQVEGIYHEYIITFNNARQQQNPKFIKCRLGSVKCGSYTVQGTDYNCVVKNAVFLHCKIVDYVGCGIDCSETFINCYVYKPNTPISKYISEMIFRNCVVYFTSSNLYNAKFTNCIMLGGSPYYYNTATTFQNCLLKSGTFGNLPASSNHYWTYENTANIFKTYTGTYKSDETFELNDDAKTQYVDENGKEIGINGGTFPYNPRVAGPHIKSMEVAPRSTADGMLNVKMTIENTGY